MNGLAQTKDAPCTIRARLEAPDRRKIWPASTLRVEMIYQLSLIIILRLGLWDKAWRLVGQA
jgi:hypothetical protein